MNTLIQMLPNIAAAKVLIVVFFKLAKIIRKITAKILTKFSDHKTVIRLSSQMMFIIVFIIGFFIALRIINLDKAVTAPG